MKTTVGNNVDNRQNIPSREDLIAEYTLQVGDKIREARQEKKISQKALAHSINITAEQLCRIERGDCRPSKATLQKLSAYIGIPYPELIRLTGYNNATGDIILYDKNGEIINTSSILYSLYRADSDFLKCFYNFETIGTPENIEVIKLLINAMQKEVNLGNTQNVEKKSIDSFFLKTFTALKSFIIETLAPC